MASSRRTFRDRIVWDTERTAREDRLCEQHRASMGLDTDELTQCSGDCPCWKGCPLLDNWPTESELLEASTR